MRTAPAFALLVLLLTQAIVNGQPAKPAPAAPPLPNVVLTGKAAVKVLKPRSRDAPAHVSGYWTPMQSDIKALEADAPAFLSHQPHARRPQWSHYARQYAGYVQNGHKMIYVNCAFRKGTEAFDQHLKETGAQGLDWAHKAFVICDGGAQFFGMEYDVQSHQFRHLSFNGPG